MTTKQIAPSTDLALVAKLRSFLADENDRLGLGLAQDDIQYVAERLPTIFDAVREKQGA